MCVAHVAFFYCKSNRLSLSQACEGGAFQTGFIKSQNSSGDMRVPAWKADTPVAEQRLLDAALAELLDSYFDAVAKPLGRRYQAMREAWTDAGGATP